MMKIENKHRNYQTDAAAQPRIEIPDWHIAKHIKTCFCCTNRVNLLEQV